MWIASSLDTIKTPTVIALGNFDGIHRGHQRVIQPIVPGAVGVSDRQEVDTDRGQPQVTPQLVGGYSAVQPLSDASLGGDRREVIQAESAPALATVVTFYPHPQSFFTGQPKQLLTPIPEKVALLQSLGIEQLVLLPFDREMANLTPTGFVHEILLTHLQAQRISVGADFRFGRQRTGAAEDLAAIAAAHHVAVTIVPLLTEQAVRISSSAIRAALATGDLTTANHLLGRPYGLTGTVIKGQQLGRTLGFPTANLQIPPEKFLPRDGVYGVRVGLESDGCLAAQWHLGVMNMGHRPTVAGVDRSIEVHVLDWSGDLYGQTVVVQLLHFVRPEQKFAALTDLQAQIQRDCETVKNCLAGGDRGRAG